MALLRTGDGRGPRCGGLGVGQSPVRSPESQSEGQ